MTHGICALPLPRVATFHGHHREQIFILTVLFENVTKGLNEPGAILGVAPRRVDYSENVIHLKIIQGLHSIITWNGGICNHKIRQCWNGVFLNDRIPLFGRVALHFSVPLSIWLPWHACEKHSKGWILSISKYCYNGNCYLNEKQFGLSGQRWAFVRGKGKP